MARLLVADDDAGVRSFLALTLRRDGHEVSEAADGSIALRKLRDERFDLVLSDLRMPGADGMEVVRFLHEHSPEVAVIVLTAHAEVKTAVEAMRLGAFDFLQKPLESPQALRDLVRQALARSATTHPLSASVGPALSWGAESMKAVTLAVSKVARSAATVLILGESGTGKELVARAIHEQSPRAKQPFVAINCAVLSSELFASELFGHEKGSFTGAHAARKGRFELAEGGTLFFDEIAELELPLQAKLLRVLEERRIDRVGGSQPIAVDVRVIAATHRDLPAMVKNGTFREDLYYRLAVVPLSIPPLSARREDILPMAEVMLAKICEPRPAMKLSQGARDALQNASFPGNARELRNLLERAVILADGPVLQAADLNLAPAAPEPAAGERVAPAAPRETLEQLERAAIERALREAGGNRKRAAESLGIALRTFYDKVARHGLG